jgi:hypothetical protein
LGIGTSSPSAKLQVSAGTNLNLRVQQLVLDNFSGDGIGALFSRTSSDDSLAAIGVADTEKLGLFSREGIIFATGGASLYSQTSERMRIDSSGNLGIGTASPAYKLDVSGTFRVTGNSTLATIASGTWNGSTIGVAYGGTGTTTAQSAMNTFAGAVTSGSYLRGNGTNVVMSTIQAGDVPTLNQNTTGYARYLNTTNQGLTGAQGLRNVTSTTDWADMPIGYSAMFTANQTSVGTPSSNYGFFIKIANRDGGGGWGGIWVDYSGGDTYVGNTTVSSSYATWYKLLSSTNYSSYALPLSGGTVTGLIGSSRNDVQRILETYNTSAGSPTQFFIEHNYGSVNIGNSRGNINISAGSLLHGGNQVLHAGNYSSYAIPNGGSWIGDLASYGFTRYAGCGMPSGSEFSIMYKGGQGYTLIDGSYYAYESGGFYSSSNSAGNTLLGFYADTTSSINFNTTTVKLSGNQVLHAGNYNSYSPTLTGTGASGTWAIGISGNASTATTATNQSGGTITVGSGGTTITKITITNTAPSSGTGSNGDLWLQY